MKLTSRTQSAKAHPLAIALANAFQHKAAIEQFVTLVKAFNEKGENLQLKMEGKSFDEAVVACLRQLVLAPRRRIFEAFQQRYLLMLTAKDVEEYGHDMAKAAEACHLTESEVRQAYDCGSRLWDVCGNHLGLLPFLPLEDFTEERFTEDETTEDELTKDLFVECIVQDDYNLQFKPEDMKKAVAAMVSPAIANAEWAPALYRVGQEFFHVLHGKPGTAEMQKILELANCKVFDAPKVAQAVKQVIEGGQ